MSSLKSSNYRRQQDAIDKPSGPGIAKVRQLQELFPSWSDDDLKSLLQEVNYDVDLAATRISDGRAEQWGAVTRKKDKRGAAASSAQAVSDRGSSRGARGGRGGARGGRGGSGRGISRGGHRETNGRHAPSPAPHPSSSVVQATPAPAGAETPNDWSKTDSEIGPAADSKGGDVGESSAKANVDAEASSASNRVETDVTPNTRVNGATVGTPVEAKSQAPTSAPAPAAAPSPAPATVPVSKPAVKTPGTTKMSWAQIARPHERPKPVPVAVHTPPPAATTSAQPPAPAAVVPEPTPVPEFVTAPPPEAEPEQRPEPITDGWEEPTTAQAPTWDDEPLTQPTVKATTDGWITSVTNQTEVKPELAPAEPVQPSHPIQPEPEPERLPGPSAFPAQLGLQQKADTPVAPPAKPSTPVSYARSLNSRAGHRFKTDQAVIIPSTFGTSVEKLGMQFGSVNLGGDDIDIPEAPGPETSALAPSAPEPAHEPQTTQASPPEPAPAPKEQTPLLSTQNLFQQVAPQQSQSQQPQTQTQVQQPLQAAQQTPPSLLPSQASSQSTVSSQTASTTATSTPLTSFSAQQHTPSSQSSISPYQQQSAQQQSQAPQPQSAVPNQLQQQQSQLQQQFSHFPSHLDQPASSQSPPQSQPLQQQQQSSLHQGISSHGSYYRQPEQTFQHASTPPAGQTQDQPYGSFAPLSQQLGYQTQNSHLGGFGSDHFGYNDAPRVSPVHTAPTRQSPNIHEALKSQGFYDSYGQQSSFGSRNALGHDDLGKSLPGGQQTSQGSTGLPQAAAQGAQQQASQQPQNATQPQGPTAGQPQGGYAPLPYFYNVYQPGQFYGPPYGSGYGIGQYANRYPQQQPPLFQPTNPSSASPANAKGPSAVQPQSNPYAPGLYGQQHSAGYDDGYGHHNQLGPQHNQGISGLPTNDYGKPLYGGQGIQSFIGQSASPAQLGQRSTGATTSPENSYKPYGPGVGAKDVGGGPGVGSGIAGGQGALGQSGRGGVQQPQHSQFYAANRFSSNPGAGGPPGQQGAQQQNQGYPQGAADNAFYYQRPSQNGPPYWA